VFPRALFAAILDAFDADADILTVYKDGKPLSSVLSLYHGGEVLPYYGGGLPEARTWRANDHMYWQLMEHARRRGCTSFDFGRSKFGTGPFAFKKNWGFEPAPLHYEFRLAEGEALPDLSPNNPKYKAMIALWTRLPLWLANRAGPLVSRGLG
jgi:FemAB-related protein (PEP-CTERM system-associated)